jgi:hypothetical protein
MIGLIGTSLQLQSDYNRSRIEVFLMTSVWRISHQFQTDLSASFPRGPHRRHHVEQFLCRPVGCHGDLVYSNLLPGNDSFAVICCNGNMISEPLLSDGRVALVFSHHVTIRIEYYLMGYDEILVNMYQTAWRDPIFSQRTVQAKYWIKPGETRKCAMQWVCDVTSNTLFWRLLSVILLMWRQECAAIMLTVHCRSEARTMLHGALTTPLFVPRAYTVLYPRTSGICRS